MNNILIIGNGTAGNEAAFTLRSLDSDAGITILSAEPYPEYDPCSLTYYISNDISRKQVFRRTESCYKKHRISLHTGEKAVTLNAEKKQVATGTGNFFNYDKLVIATGGKPIFPPIDGIEMKGVFTCKYLSDAENIRRYKTKRAVVIGSGAIGIEAAEALKKNGCEVTVIELLDCVLPTLFDKPVAKLLGDDLVKYGITLHTGEKVLHIQGKNKVEEVITNKRKIACDKVIMAAGVTPCSQIAKKAGIRTNRGILVNEYMETNIPGIFACGDCAETRDAFSENTCNYQLKHNAIDQGRIVAGNLLGQKIRYPGSYPFARAHFFDTHAASFGKTLRSAGDVTCPEVIERSDGTDTLFLILDNGRIIGGQATGRYADSLGLFMGALWRGDDFNEIRKNWKRICSLGSSYPWIYRKMGRLMGLKLAE
ncbi:MAG: FAD-dependent oxidoreductase [Bacteroidetes bacterium]|nr:FAD-dependent oxidoreductase [Bacteroidota bacterium]